MNLWSTMDLFGGGPGSGCRGPNCGRPESAGKSFDVNRILKRAEDQARIDDKARQALANPKKPGKWRQYDPAKVGGYFRQGTVVANIYKMLEAKQGQWIKLNSFENRFVRTGAPVIRNRLKEIRYTGKRAGLWNLEIDETRNQVRFQRLSQVGQKPAKKQDADNETPPAKGMVKNPANAGALADIEQTLKKGNIVAEKYRGGGVNSAKTVTFEDGSKGVLKYGTDTDSGRRSIISGKGPNREAGAYEVAKLVGMADMVPVTVMRNRAGDITSVQEFRKGEEAGDKPKDVKYDGNKDAARAAAFDYVIGNEDRHEGNWMLNNQGKITLIDHGLSFPEKTTGMDFNQKLIGYAQKKGFQPQAQAEPYVRNKAEIISALKSVGLRDAAIDGVSNRIDKLAWGSTYAQIAPNVKAQETWKNGGDRWGGW